MLTRTADLPHAWEQVLQLPIVKNRLKKLLLNGVKKIAHVGTPVIPSSEDTLDQFLHSAGKFFGKDPAEWKHMGEQHPGSTWSVRECFA